MLFARGGALDLDFHDECPFSIRVKYLQIGGALFELQNGAVVNLQNRGILQKGEHTMSKAKELLLECKIKLGIQTDYKLAQALEIHTGRVADYMNGKRAPDAYTCVRMALILGRDPAEVIAEVEADTEKNDKRRAFWADFLQRASKAAKLGTLALCFMASLLGAAASPERAAFFKRRDFA